jgi:PTS system fructose-specific IIA component
MTDTPAPVVTPAIVSLDVPLGDDSKEIVRALTSLLHDAGRVDHVDSFVDAVLAREALGPTVIPGGVAIPHARNAAVATHSVAVARLPQPVAFSEETPARVVLLIAGPADDPEGYLRLLSKIVTACVKTAFVTELLEAKTADQLAGLVDHAAGRR